MEKDEKLRRFKLKAIRAHKGYYLYDKVDYIDSKTKVCIECPLHGEFWQTPAAHVNGQICPKCANKRRGDALRSNKEDLISELRRVHGDKYDYSKVEYVNAMTPVKIICPIHGEFEKIPMLLLKGQGCPKCAGRNLSNDEVVERMKNAHPDDDYDYSKVEFTKMHNKVCIVCHKKDCCGNEHGEFWQTPAKHIIGRGCPKCGNVKKNERKKITVEKLKERGNYIFNRFYNYDNVDFENLHDKIRITCPVHGEYMQYAYDHLKGHGCTQCAIDKSKLELTEFIQKSRNIHGDKYDYSKVEYKNSYTNVCIVCPEHGEFWQDPGTHLKGCGCPKCGKIISKNEEELYQFVCNLVGSENVERNNRDILDGKEIDIYISSLKIGIEYNGVVWHSEKFGKDRYYHLDKLETAVKNGVKLIQVFEDEYIDSRNIVFGKIRHILGYDNYQQKVYARKCEVRVIDKDIARKFLNDNHIQGYGCSTLFIGGFNDDELVGVMGFKEETKKSGKWELTRFATDITKLCCGLGGKLFKYFIDSYSPDYVKSFADRRWTMNMNDNLYIKLGFKLEKVLSPEYRYIESGSYKRFHKFGYRKQILHKKYGLSLDLTESEMTDKLGIYKIWDCGLLKYVWKREK